MKCCEKYRKNEKKICFSIITNLFGRCQNIFQKEGTNLNLRNLRKFNGKKRKERIFLRIFIYFVIQVVSRKKSRISDFFFL